MGGDYPKPPPRRAKILRIGIHQYRILRALCKERMEVIGKSAVYIIGQDNQIRTIFLHDIRNTLQATVVKLYGKRVAWVNAEENLDRRIFELVDFIICVLPLFVWIGVDRDFFQRI